jgi:hypothetical protein
MIFRLSVLIVLAVTSGVSATETPLLRLKKNLDEDKPGPKKKGSFHVEKGIKCDGGFDKSKGVYKKCEGGMKSEFSMGASGKEIANGIATDLLEQIDGFKLSGSKDAFFANDEAVKAMSVTNEDDVDFYKTIEFGGTMGVDWGCKVTFGKDLEGPGGFSKKVECGLKGHVAKGKKQDEIDEALYEYF